jgi:hypothetical protein
MKPNQTKPFSVKVIDACASLGIELQKDVVVRIKQSPWMINTEQQIITSLRALSKGAGIERIRAEMKQVMEEEGLSEYEHIYTDGSLKEGKVSCAVVLPTATLKYRLVPQTTSFNAEMFAIWKARFDLAPPLLQNFLCSVSSN